MGLSFVLSMFMVIPEPEDLIAGMIPGIPDEPNAFLIIAGMTGTTCGAIVFVMRSIIVAEKGLDNQRPSPGKNRRVCERKPHADYFRCDYGLRQRARYIAWGHRSSVQ